MILILGSVTESATALADNDKPPEEALNLENVTEESMQSTSESRDWYAFRVRPRHEKLVSMSLRGKGYEEFLPLAKSKRKWADRSPIIEMPLFPGYIFCDTERTEIGKIRCTRGILDVIRAGPTPLPANRGEIEGLRQATKAELELESLPYIDPSTAGRLRIISGPLNGLDGMLVQVRGKERLILSVDLLCRSVLVEVPLSSVACVSYALSDPPTPPSERLSGVTAT